MKKVITLLLAAGLVIGAASAANAVDIKAKGLWHNAMSFADRNFEKHNGSDKMQNATRIRTQIDVIASESLKGVVYFEIGPQNWGKGADGASLGTDGKVVKVRYNYVDWVIPQTDAKVRMGLQNFSLPGFALPNVILGGGGADGAGITLSTQFTKNIGATLFWLRAENDNTDSATDYGKQYHYSDAMDFTGITLPLKFDGVKVTPWAMYGMAGANANTLTSTAPYARYANGGDAFTFDPSSTSKAYGSMFWAGLPISLTLWDPLNVELDINYGYVESMGRYEAERYDNTFARMGDTKREGWLVKALVEYKMDWGTPGIFGWYASGDDGNVKNGSERMPSVSGCGNFMSFMGDGNYGWSTSDSLYDRNMTYAGTWGIGLRIHDLSFVEDLKHSFRVAYWGGTNSPSMAKYVGTSYGWQNFNNENNFGEKDGPYLTTNDGLLEFNLVNSYQIYENLEANLELGYIVNLVDDDTWKRSYRNDSYKKQDAWKAQLIFAYSF